MKVNKNYLNQENVDDSIVLCFLLVFFKTFNFVPVFSSLYFNRDQYLNPSTNNVPHHIETTQLICIANQLTGFYRW